MTSTKRKYNITIGTGKSDSWGFSAEYSPYENSFAIMLIHWYVYVEVWQAKENADAFK